MPKDADHWIRRDVREGPMVAGKLPGKQCPRKCGKTVALLPVARTGQWVALETHPDQTDGAWQIEHGEAVPVTKRDVPKMWRYQQHVCKRPETPMSEALDLFATDGGPTETDAPEGVLGPSQAIPGGETNG